MGIKYLLLSFPPESPGFHLGLAFIQQALPVIIHLFLKVLMVAG
jgi:hypothetical protein